VGSPRERWHHRCIRPCCSAVNSRDPALAGVTGRVTAPGRCRSRCRGAVAASSARSSVGGSSGWLACYP
jgi:hypothetical protein